MCHDSAPMEPILLRIAPTPPPTPPDSSPTDPRIISVHISPQRPEWATSEPRLSADIPDSTTNHPERAPFLPTLPRRSHESFRIILIRLDSGLGPKNFFRFSGRAPDQPRITKNQPDSPRTCYGSTRTTPTLLRLTPTHPDSRFVAHSAPDSGMCNWGFTRLHSRRLQDLCRRLTGLSWKRLENVFKTMRYVHTLVRRLGNVGLRYTWIRFGEIME